MNHTFATFLLVAAGLAPSVSLPAQQAVEASASKGAPAADSVQPGSIETVRPAALPQAITSFGACRSRGFLYVYGGHIGRAHAHSRDNVIGDFQRLNLADGTSWETLPASLAVQGTALVAASDGSLYRIGGMTALNDAAADDDLHSTASVQRFDPRSNTWQDATVLPEPRSSHDAIVLDDTVYVVGGWLLNGDDNGRWHDTAWCADLREQPLVWRELPRLGQPRRACAVAAFGGRIAVLGGIDDSGMINTVRVFDPASQSWSSAPDLPGKAFGTAAIGVGDTLYASVMDGRLLRWHGTGEWLPAGQLALPRFFHRFITTLDGEHLLACGGAGGGDHMRAIERVRLAASTRLEMHEWTLPAPTRVTHRQALVLHDNTLWAFGGNRGLAGDRFANDQYADDIWRIELDDLRATLVGTLPEGRQSMAAVRWPGGERNLLLGGLGIVAGLVQSSDTGIVYDRRRREVAPIQLTMPGARTQFETVVHGGRLWVLGGTNFTPDDDGGSTTGDASEVLECDLDSKTPAFTVAPWQLPRARRSFAAATLGDKLYVIGGLGDDFEHAGPIDVRDFVTGEWSQLEAPTPWVSCQVTTIGERLYVACGGTMRGQRFTEDRSVWSWCAAEGWRQVVPELPFAVRHMQMLTLRDRLLFYSASEGGGDRIVLRLLKPDPTACVIEAGAHH